MIQYIYFVKCPNCEDEPFDFFSEAKDYALGCLSQKPVITQIEVDRNDFGECVDSHDYGTIWSWEDMMKETDAEPAVSIFTKDDLTDFDPGCDREFADLDDALDDVPDNFRKPIPDGMTIEELVEEMEENEDMVECTWCEELFDKSECRREVDLGWLCGRCEAAIKSRGEPLTFRENDYWDFLDENVDSPEDEPLVESDFSHSKEVEFEYHDLEVTLQGPKRDVDDWDEEERTVYFLYTKNKDDVAMDIWDHFITDEDAADVLGGLDTLEDEDEWTKFLDTHWDALLDKYYNALLEYYRNDAAEEYERTHGLDESASKSFLEELEDTETYRKRLALCPECGEQTFDHETGICINCGFNILKD